MKTMYGATSGSIFRKLLLLIVISLITVPLFCDESLEDLIGGPVRILTVGRESFQGTLHAVLEDRLEIVLADGQIIQILRSEITETTQIDLTTGKRALFQDAASNRLMVMPTAFPMGHREFDVTDQEIAVVTASYGLTPNISLWAGISIPGFVVSGRFSYLIGPTVGITAGAFAGVEWFDGSALVLPYGIMSIGSRNRNFTFGGAAVYTVGDSALDGAVAALGGKFVLTPTSALVSENWFIWNFEEGIPFPSINALGISFRIAGNRLSWDIGAIVLLTVYETQNNSGGTGYRLAGIFGDTVIPIPLISLTYRID